MRIDDKFRIYSVVINCYLPNIVEQMTLFGKNYYDQDTTLTVSFYILDYQPPKPEVVSFLPDTNLKKKMTRLPAGSDNFKIQWYLCIIYVFIQQFI